MSWPALAQRLPFELYGPERGLTSLTIQCILQDADKVLWVGTRDGLFRYTGERFTPYLEEQGLPSQRINGLLVFGSQLWVATRKGAAIWNGNGFENPFDAPSPLSGLPIYSFAAVGDRLLLGTDSGVWEAKRTPGKRFDIRNLGAPGPIFALHAASDGAVWAAGENQLLRIDPLSGRIETEGQSLPPQRWRAVQETADGSIWVRNADQLWRRPSDSPRFELAASLVRTEDNLDLFRTPDGGLAVPTLNGLRFWRNGVWSVLDAAQGLPASWTAAAYWDHEGDLWVGLAARGVARERGQGRWLSWTVQDGLPHTSVNGIARDHQGLLWVSTPDGVASLPENGRPGRILREKDGLPADNAVALVADDRGSVWIGYAYSGVVRIHGTAPPQRLGPDQGLPNRVFALQLDAEGQIWASTRSGLFVAPTAAEHPRFTQISITPDHSEGAIYSVVFASDGVLWVASSDGLFRRTGTGWQHFTTADGLLEAGIVFAAPGRNGEIWIGYGQQGGVAKVGYGNGQLHIQGFSTKNATLLSNDLNFVRRDARGWLWVGTHRGVDLFDGADWRHLDFQSGLAGADTIQNAFHIDPDGSVWIGTNSGLSRFRPPVPLPAAQAPDAWLATSFGKHPVSPDGVLQIPWSERAFTAHFAPATFESESSAVSRFRLLGQSQAWTETNEHLQTFADMSPGDYVLEVQASLDRAHWSSSTTRLAFRILPAWWQRWWVQLGAAVLFLAVLRTGWTIRMKRHVRQKADLERQVAERAVQITEQQRHLEIEKASKQKAMRAASESDRRFRALLEDVRLATLICDRNGQISFCNDYMLALTGWSSAEVIGRDWIQTFVPPEERDILRSRFDARSLRIAGPDYYECSIATRDGRKRIFQWNNTELRDEAGGLLGVASIGADVTEQRQIAEQNLQAQKMESMGRLAGGVAHDFNNLLTVINGYGDLLLRKLPADSPVLKPVTEIRKAGARAAELSQQMLTFSRKQAIQPTALNLNDVVLESAALLERLVGEDVRIETKLDPALGRVKADSGQISQVLMNLAANARDAMPNGGRLLIETSGVNMDGAPTEDGPAPAPVAYAQLAVTDTGIGMNEETKKHIFEPFFTLKERGRGTGLGLATVYGIVQQSQGMIRVDSAPDQGTTFRILLPEIAGGAAEPAVSSPAPDTRSLNGAERILVVEDDAEVREFVVEVLGSLGYEVISACSGPDALTQAGAFTAPVDLLLTDIVMPGMTGRELADRLLRVQPDLKVLYMSGYPDDVLAPRGILDAGVAHLPKPFQPDVLASKVRAVLSRTA